MAIKQYDPLANVGTIDVLESEPPPVVYMGPKDKNGRRPATTRLPEYLYEEYPRVMHHATKPSVLVESDEDVEALGPEWTKHIQGEPTCPSKDDLEVMAAAKRAGISYDLYVQKAKAKK